MDTNIEFTMKF